MFSRLTWYQASKYLHHNSVKKTQQSNTPQWPVITKWSSAQVTDALLELHFQSSVLNPRPAELMQATIQEHGLKIQKSSTVHSTWESKLDQDKSACQGMLSVCHGWSHKEGRWQFGLLTKNQDKWTLLEGITNPCASIAFHGQNSSFLACLSFPENFLPDAHPVLWKINKETQNKQKKKSRKKATSPVLLLVKLWDLLWHELHLQATL